MQPPAQELMARDLHDNAWTFRHIYRGIAPFSKSFSVRPLIRLYSVKLRWWLLSFFFCFDMSLLPKWYFNPILLFTINHPSGLSSIYNYSRINMIHLLLFGVNHCFISCSFSSSNLTVSLAVRITILLLCQKCTKSVHLFII